MPGLYSVARICGLKRCGGASRERFFRALRSLTDETSAGPGFFVRVSLRGGGDATRALSDLTRMVNWIVREARGVGGRESEAGETETTRS
jgi:hypothetical protein